MKVAVYTITKNEQHFIPRWAESCKDADLRLIVDTGSTDDTVNVAKENGCTVAEIAIKPWRFDDARNASLALIPGDFDYCIALDADEVLTPGWREALELVPPNVTRPRYKYVWSWNDDGSEGLTYSGDKIHARHNYRWKHPVHEVAICTAEEVQGWCELQIHHYPDQSKSRSQYLPLLEQSVREDPGDDRNRFYLGRELMFNNRNEEAAIHLQEHLKLSTWPAERATCMRYMGRVTGNKEHWFLRACAEAPYRREPWVELANFYHDERRWLQSLSATHNALAIREKPLEYLCEADAWGALPHDLAGVCAWNIGLKEISLRHHSDAFAMSPQDERIRNNYAVVLALMATTPVEIIIPTRSNLDGLAEALSSIAGNASVSKIHIIADGQEAFQDVSGMDLPVNAEVYLVDDRPGIHAMWNLGLRKVNQGSHVLFMNDDVRIDGRAIDIMSSLLDRNKDAGLLCPNYDGRPPHSTFIDVTHTCRGDYGGTGGLGGFCMMLAADLAFNWSFDERMKWWYGDDDLLYWVLQRTNRRAAIVPIAKCSGNSSFTIDSDPPPNFASVVNQDREFFLEKWPQT